ncbi:diacylglycerol kinase family protein [Pasteuria penetrans]|uniref:diacylglycerol kinase family protein n=1 Tax=Pasteuria penetrans TaxID=86005 RepID=UPI000FA1F74F|nr:diacylglycerol kinase family protein [Pasteuria penetrans]
MIQFIRSAQHAWRGLEYTLRTQRNMRIYCAALGCAILFALVMSFTILEWLMLLLPIGAVLGAELFNTALEAVVDLVSPQYHPLAKVAKDTAAAAVSIAVVLAVAVVIGLFALRLLFWIRSARRWG